MKRYIIKAIFAAAAVIAAVACDKQDDSYREYVVIGGYNYPAKPDSVVANPGFHRVAVSWRTPKDPAVKSVKLFWDNYSKSIDVDYSTAKDGWVTAYVDNLEERSYSFDVVNYDGNGNKSLASEVTASPYGEGWLSTHAERRVRSMIMDGEDALVSLGNPIDEMVSTVFRYKDVSGKWIETEPVPADQFDVVFAKALKGKNVEYRSSFRPAKGIDLVWNENWTKTIQPILYRLSGEDWEYTVTDRQMRGDDYAPKFMFDGDLETRYYSSTNTTLRKSFPKIVAVNTKTTGDQRPTVTMIRVYQHPTESKSRYVKSFNFYVGDEPFNVDDTDYLTDFGTPAVDATLKQDDAMQSRTVNSLTGSCFAVAFKSSYNTNGYIDVLEFEMIGFVAANAD